MVVLMITSSVSNNIHYNLFQPEGGPDPKLDTDILNVMALKQETSSKGFSSFRTVKVTTGGFTKPFLREYVVILCKFKTEPLLSKKLFSPEECSVE